MSRAARAAHRLPARGRVDPRARLRLRPGPGRRGRGGRSRAASGQHAAIDYDRPMPRVSRLSIAPVRSLGLEHPESVEDGPTGVLEAPRLFLAHAANRLVDRLVVGSLVQLSSHTNPEPTVLRLTFPDGQVVEDEVRGAEA